MTQVKRLVGVAPLRVMGLVGFVNPSSINDVQISLDMNLSGLTNYYIKQ
jgi:hypothetical protein